MISIFWVGSSQVETNANVLVSFQVASLEIDELKTLADSLGYVYAFETENKALKFYIIK